MAGVETSFFCPKCGNKTMELVNQYMYMCKVCGWFRAAHDIRFGVKPPWRR